MNFIPSPTSVGANSYLICKIINSCFTIYKPRPLELWLLLFRLLKGTNKWFTSVCNNQFFCIILSFDTCFNFSVSVCIVSSIRKNVSQYFGKQVYLCYYLDVETWYSLAKSVKMLYSSDIFAVSRLSINWFV